MVTKGIYLFWDKKYEQVIYAGRFTGRKRIKDHFQSSYRNKQKINEYVQNHPDRIESVIFCEFDDISDDDLNQLEMETIKLFKLNKYRYPNSHVFNFTDGGEGMSGFVHSKESKKKISESLIGRKLSDETKKKISENHWDNSAENHPMYGKTGENHPWYGEHHSEESKKKMRENAPDRSGENNPNYGNPNNYHHAKETKKKISEKVSGENHPLAKYTLWNITKCYYYKRNMFQSSNGGMSPRRCFSTKYNGKMLPIGMNLDFYTPELINDLINESLGVN